MNTQTPKRTDTHTHTHRHTQEIPALVEVDSKIFLFSTLKAFIGFCEQATFNFTLFNEIN